MRVLVSGYYGFGNTGDEAVLAGLIEGFRELAPDAELVVLSGNPAATMAEHSVIAVPRGLRSARRQTKQCDLLVSGGGGLLQDVTSWWSPLYYLAIIQFARQARRPVACIGHSFGPLRRSLIKRVTRDVLSKVQVITVRDELSKKALMELGVARPLEITADLAFLLPRPTPEEINEARRLAGLNENSGPIAAIALRPHPSGGPPDLAGRLGAAIGKVCAELRIRPLLVPMQPSQDISFAREAAQVMPGEPLITTTPMSARQVLALIAGGDLMIGMRLHALIFAALAGVPLVGISYDPKVDGMLEQLGASAATSIARLYEEALSGVIRETWQARAERTKALSERTEGMRAMALRNVELALAAVVRKP